MYCREQFLKSPPPQLFVDSADENSDDCSTRKNKRKGRRRTKRSSKAIIDDPSNWITDDEEDDDDSEDFSPSTLKELCALESEIKLSVMKEIFDAQTDEVKNIIIGLHKLQIKKRKARRMKQLIGLPSMNMRKKIRNRLLRAKKSLDANRMALTSGTGLLHNNAKLLARMQRYRRRKRNKSGKRRAKFPRRKRRINAKRGNRQFRKRIFRAQKFFQKGIFLASGRLLEEVCKAVKDVTCTATTFCNNNTHALSKAHRKQIALYEKIECDLQRLDIVRQERADAAEQRLAKEQEKIALRQILKNRIEMRAAAQLQNSERRKERRAARKLRASERKARQDLARAELSRYSISAKAVEDIACKA